ncbi:MAG: hypothetical protein HY718_06345, partial [Planctomycetes bacterium]|nr:hypothetical protein [Planctomycetota bacterium]
MINRTLRIVAWTVGLALLAGGSCPSPTTETPSGDPTTPGGIGQQQQTIGVIVTNRTLVVANDFTQNTATLTLTTFPSTAAANATWAAVLVETGDAITTTAGATGQLSADTGATITYTAPDNYAQDPGDDGRFELRFTATFDSQTTSITIFAQNRPSAAAGSSLVIDPASLVVGGNEGGTVTYRVTLASEPTAVVTVNILPDTTNGFITAAPAFLTFTSGNFNVQQTVTVTLVDDNFADGAHSATVAHTLVSDDPAFNNVLAPTVTVNIADNDDPCVNLDPPAPAALAESAGTSSTITANLVDSVTAADLRMRTPLSVHLGFTGTAEFGTDYFVSAGSITIPAGASSGTMTVTPIDDPYREADETVIVTINSAEGADICTPPQTRTVTITDDAGDLTPVISITPAEVVEGNPPSTTVAVFNVLLTAPSEQTVSVSFATSDLTATAGADYVAIPLTVLTFLPGQVKQTIDVTVNGDTVPENDEKFLVTLSAPTNATLAANAVGIGTILDDDALPTVTLSLLGSPFAETGGSATLTATASTLSDRDVIVDLDFLGSATFNTDYTVSAKRIVIPAGSLSASITITASADTCDEPDETIVVGISALVNATLGATVTQTATITDDDAPPTVTLAPAPTSPIGESGAPTSTLVTATLSAASCQDVLVNLGFTGTADLNRDYSASASQIVIPAGSVSGTITLASVNDNETEGPETATVTIA